MACLAAKKELALSVSTGKTQGMRFNIIPAKNPKSKALSRLETSSSAAKIRGAKAQL